MNAHSFRSADHLEKIGVVGGGLIGLSWASLFVAFGLDVIIYDPNPEAEAEIDGFLDSACSAMQSMGFELAKHRTHPHFTSRIEDLSEVQYVQENGPDRLSTKRQVIAAIEQVVDKNIVIASSTSSLLATDLQLESLYPERILVAHPMNPPHMVPLVELVGGKNTSERTIALAEAFYKRLARVPIRIGKELVGHVANRLTAALYREAVFMAATGVASVEDIDKAVAYGPGMRWALAGPHLTYHMGGGKGGYRHYLDHLGPTQELRWQELGTVELTEEVKALLIAGLDEELKRQDNQTLVHRRDLALAEILAVKRKYAF